MYLCKYTPTPTTTRTHTHLYIYRQTETDSPHSSEGVPTVLEIQCPTASLFLSVLCDNEMIRDAPKI